MRPYRLSLTFVSVGALALAGLGCSRKATNPPVAQPRTITGPELAKLRAQVDAQPRELARLQLGMLYLRAGAPDEAAVQFEEALEMKSDDPVAWNNLGLAFSGLGLWDNAIAASEKAVRLQPNLEQARNNSINAQKQKETPTPPTAQAERLGRLGLAHYRAGRFAESTTLFELASKIDPNNATVWNDLGASYGNQGKFKEEVAACEKALKLKPDFQLAKNNLEYARGQLKAKPAGKAKKGKH